MPIRRNTVYLYVDLLLQQNLFSWMPLYLFWNYRTYQTSTWYPNNLIICSCSAEFSKTLHDIYMIKHKYSITCTIWTMHCIRCWFKFVLNYFLAFWYIMLLFIWTVKSFLIYFVSWSLKVFTSLYMISM